MRARTRSGEAAVPAALVGLAVCLGMVWVLLGTALVEVHRAEPTVDAAPYLAGGGPDAAAVRAAVERGLRNLPRGFGRFPARYPVEPGPLRRGKPRTAEGAPGSQAYFVLGRNDAPWMRANAAWLRSLGAVGYVVDAPTERDLAGLVRAASAEGLVLVPVPGEAVAEIGGPQTYPAVVLPTENEGGGG